MKETYCPKCGELILIKIRVCFAISRALHICGKCGYKFYKNKIKE